MSDSLYIVIPAYNEEMNIDTVVRQWYQIVEKTGPDSRLVIVNDGSRDRTGERLETLARELPQLIPLTKKNGGHGAAVLYGYHYALRCDADYIFQTDSDGQTLPSEFPAFWKRRRQYSVQIGYRQHRQDGFSRIFVTKTLRLVLKLIFRLDIPDANTPFRLMNRRVLARYIDQVPRDFNLSNVMLTVLFMYYHEQVRFYPITFRPRQGGVNSINMRKIVRIGRQAVLDFYHIRRRLK
ncbi:MAG TPA: glycosyltransferase family 2 protein [Candidatus Egerieimonas intestinavium]|uniref:Glycosyltransferase family 2 protein n=1 Tax=Candidatus Egerieimonas intestinavium TaxID=2840777 RepID=A0A9D1EJ38_9FIRM|nr:glycosyltransferase family 2 protein [Candidatus Egerieimonas intestinavium]